MATSVTARHFGIIKDGVRHYYDKNFHNKNLAQLEGQQFEEVIKMKRKNVSLRAFAFYRGPITSIALQSEMFGGWTKEELHDFFCERFLSNILVTKVIKHGQTFLKERTVVGNTSSMSSKEMSEFTEKVLHFLANNDIIIDNPDNYES
jgi:hypothetical protein